MGKHSGNGMGSAFRAYWPPARSGAAMQRDVDRRHGHDPETVRANRELDRVAGLGRHMGELVRKTRLSGAHPLEILKALADEIRHAERCVAALGAARKRR